MSIAAQPNKTIIRGSAQRHFRRGSGAIEMPLYRRLSRAGLLTGASVAALLMVAPQVHARSLNGGSSTASMAAAAASQANAQEASRAARAAQESLTRATQSIRGLQAMQQMARDAALAAGPSGIPNGLKPGGLQVAPGAAPGSELWRGANLPTEFTEGGRTKTSIVQTQSKAILTWGSFNVSEKTDLHFDQRAGGTKAGEWIVLNRVLDSSAAPSRILGTIKAEGQVYVINRNGIIFGGASQVNVGSLVASSLNLSNEQFLAGINAQLSLKDQWGAPTTFLKPQFGEYTEVVPDIFSPVGGVTPFKPSYGDNLPGSVQVEAGAHIAAAPGGKLMLFAPKVLNAGSLRAPDGQVIMAAGENVWLSSIPATATTGSTPYWSSPVRGLEVAVSSVPVVALDYYNMGIATGLYPSSGDTAPFTNSLRDIVMPMMADRAAQMGYRVTNLGHVEAQRGDITLASPHIVQGGTLLATTALNNREGSVRIQAWGQGMLGANGMLEFPTMIYWQAGKVEFTPGSVTAVMPDLTDASEIELGAVQKRYRPGRIVVRGEHIDVQAQASLMAPAGEISILATSKPVNVLPDAPGSNDPSAQDGSRIYIDSGAYLSTAGLRDVVLPLSSQFVEVTLGINELRDNPLARDSWLRGIKVVVDRRITGKFESGPMAGVTWLGDDRMGEWVGTPLADVSAWVALSKTNIRELSTAGGKINLKAGGSVITREGSVLDISSGSIRYESGWNRTTKFVAGDGRIVDISAATPDMRIVALARGFTRDHQRWNVTETWTSVMDRAGGWFERGYTQGDRAGEATIFAGGAFILEGGFWAGAIAGERQLAPGQASRDGSLTLGGDDNAEHPFSPGEVIITDKPKKLATNFGSTSDVDDAFFSISDDGNNRTIRKSSWLSADMLNESGLGKIIFNVRNQLTLEKGVVLRLNPGASLTVAPAALGTPVNVTIDGSIRVPGGSIKLDNVVTRLGAGAVIDMSGQWINGPANTATGAPAIHGGSIRVSHLSEAASGSVLDVSGGGYYMPSLGNLSLGDAGEIDLRRLASDGIIDNVELRAFAAGAGGTLKLEFASSVVIGGQAAPAGTYHAPAELFADRGFRSVTIAGQGVTVADGAQVSLVPVSVRLRGDLISLPSGSHITEIGALERLRPEERFALKPTTLALTGGDILIGAGARLAVDTAGTIQLGELTDTGLALPPGKVTILGVVDAPAGSISIKTSEGLRLANGASLLARGVPIIHRGIMNLRTGTVRPGGSIELESGNLMLEVGSLIDVSGASGHIDLPSALGFARGTTALAVASDGGRIAIRGNGTVEGKLAGRPGGPGAAGGSVEFDHLEGTPAGGLAPGTAIKQTLDGWGFAVGADIGAILESWGYGDMPEMIITQQLLDRLSVAGRSDLVVSDTARHPGSLGGAINPAQYGLTSAALDAFQNYIFYSDFLRDSLRSPPDNSVLVVRPSGMAGGGFADLRLSSDHAIKLDNAALSSGRLIALSGNIFNIGTSNSTIQAPIIRLSGIGTAKMSASTSGQLALIGSLIDVSQNAKIRGFADTLFETTDLRFSHVTLANSVVVTASLDVEDRLTLKAGQIYPSTATQATIRASKSIRITRNGDVTTPLSAGGSLTLIAPEIAQDGVLRAPFGSITLKATDRVSLGEGSVTSVSGDGMILTYGNLLNDEFWLDPTQSQLNKMIDLSTPPEKRITLDAPSIDAAKGSVIDVRGGGDLHAWEFVAGTGGSHDVLAMSGAFAIMPDRAGVLAPGTDGKRIWLAGGNDLAAGWYTVLPARYALMPGAYAILPGSRSWSIRPQAMQSRADGSMIMSGYLGDAFSSARDPAMTSWQVMSGNVVRSYSEYNEAFASAFFASEAFALTQYRRIGVDIAVPRIPVDAGAVVLKATQSLTLGGELKMQAAPGGRGGLLDVAAGKIAVVGADQNGAGFAAQGYLVLDSTMLTNAGAGSLLLGGVRSGDPLGLRVDVMASDIVVQNSANSRLAGLEVILAATDNVTLRAGSVVAAEGEAAGGAVDLVMAPRLPGDSYTPARDWGALVRVSNLGDVRVRRQGVDMSQSGHVAVEAGVVLRGGQSLIVDATASTSLATSASVSGKYLTMGGGRIGFGGGSGGLVFGEEALRQLAATENLRLRSYSTIDFHRDFDFGRLGLSHVTLDAGGFNGVNGNDATIRADMLVLENTVSATASAGAATGGTLRLEARELVLGMGAKAIGGFTSVKLGGVNRITSDGVGSLHAGSAAVTIETPLLTGRDGSSQNIGTTGALVMTSSGMAPAGGTGGYGARLALTGRTVSVEGHIAALGGAVDITALAGDVLISGNGRIDVGGFGKAFYDVTEYADAGNINLTAIGGSVVLDPTASLNLSANTGGGDAGRLSVTASGGGTVRLDGTISALAGQDGKGGSFTLDIARLPDFGNLNQRLNAGGFVASRQFRVREGDVVVDGITQVSDFSLTADRGTVTLVGIVDARARYGGRIAISGGNGVVMDSSAVLYAGALDARIGTGRVTIDAAGGELVIREGVIDVAGGEGGEVRFRALQTAGHDDIRVSQLAAGIIGARAAVLEGVSVYDAHDTLHASAFDGATVDSVKADAIADAAAFAARAAAIAARLGTGVAVMAGVEVRADGDLTLNSDWNLFNDFSSQRQGTLTLRAAGNLDIRGTISDGFDASGLLDAGKSWSLRLIAGADLGSANALATAPMAGLASGKGSLTLGTAGTGAVIRTGAGDIDVRAGRDIVLADKTSAIYSAGRRDTTVFADFITPTDLADTTKLAVYGIEGGTVRLAAQGSVSAQPTGQRFTEWLRRAGAFNWETGLFVDYTDQWGTTYDGQQSSWWIDHSRFMGIGALGGGNLSVEAGGDLANVVAVQPTNARLRGGLVPGQTTQLELRNGGAFDIKAGGAIKAGYYYTGRGAGTIHAGEMTYGRTTTNGATTFNIAPVLGIGDATLDVRVQGNVILETIVDPLMIAMDPVFIPYPWGGGYYGDPGVYMSGHTNRTALRLVSVGGDITLANKDTDADYIFGDASSVQNARGAGTNRYPAFTYITALNGSVILNGGLFTMTAPVMASLDSAYTSGWNLAAGTLRAEFRLLAGQDLTFQRLPGYSTANPQIVLSRATPEMMPSPFAPRAAKNEEAGLTLEAQLINDLSYGTGPRYALYRNPENLTLSGDYDSNRIYALEGSITGTTTSATVGANIIVNKQSSIRAGGDIRDFSFNLRNLRATDTSLVEAGKDIIGSARGEPTTNGITIEGPGLLMLVAGRDIFAPGAEPGGNEPFTISSIGNQYYRSADTAPIRNTVIKGLPSTGASVTLMAGLNGRAPAYADFIAAYLDPANVAAMPDHLKTLVDGRAVPLYLTDLYETRENGVVKLIRSGLTSFMKDMTGEDLSPMAAWTRFQALPEATQQRFAREVYMQELRMAARDQLTPGLNGQPLNGGYNRGYAAIARLFPGNGWKGDVLLADGSIRTMQGGDIDVLVPGGGLQVAALGQAPAEGRGLITLGNPGDIRIFVDQNVYVNRGRALTFAGGDQIVWATLGDIDAGRGARTARSFNAPVIETDPDGKTKVTEKADITGSGLGTVEGVAGVDPDVDIAAPKGTVNAGDAGIRVGGNLNLAALYIVNAANIQVDGKAKGIPTVQAPNTVNLTEANSVAGAAAKQAALPEQSAVNAQPSVIIVEVLGYGGGADSEESNEKRRSLIDDRRSGLSPSSAAPQYEAASAIQVLGAGRLSEEEARYLTLDERRQLPIQ